MNVILLEPGEPSADGQVTLDDDRARHLRKILKVALGDEVRVGVVDGNVGVGTVIALGARSVTLRCHLDQPAPERGRDELLLAFARPKVLLRCVEHATALGFGSIVLFRSRRVEKSHMDSSAIQNEVLQRHVRRGLHQARRTHRPTITLVPRFRELLDRYAAEATREDRFVADPGAAEEAALAPIGARAFSLVIGPEGGFIQYELEELTSRGFRPVRAGHQPLRVETAVSYLTGQLRAARAIAARAPAIAVRD